MTAETPKTDGRTDFGFTKIAEEEKEDKVKHVFDVVAPKYDLMNDLLSFGMHRYWKLRTRREAAVRSGMKVLDIASGTGDLAMKFARQASPDGEVWATDINFSMLSVGVGRFREAGVSCRVAQCDCEQLPFADNYFDVVTVSFGLRNMTHKEKALREIARVLKPSGKALVLEFSRCAFWLAPFYDFYSFRFIPWLGSKIAGDRDSYRYLIESIRRHPPQAQLAEMMREAGFGQVAWHNLTFGICALHIGRKSSAQGMEKEQVQ